MLDLGKIAADAVTELEASGFIEQQVKKNMEKALQEAVEKAFRWHSPFQKALEEKVGSLIDVDFGSIGMTGYNQLIINTIQNSLHKMVDEEAAKQITETIAGIIRKPPAEIKLSAIVAKLIEDNDREALEHDWYQCTVIIRDGYYLSSKHISLDPEYDKEEHECKYRFSLDTSRGNAMYAVTIDGVATDKLLIGHDRIYGLERDLFIMAAGGTKVILDSYNTSYSGRD